jgi:uncharacterized protein YuzE
MRITYDSSVDALYIELRKAQAMDSDDIEDGVVVDFDADGHVIGIEVLDASKRLTPEELKNVTYENLVSEKKAALSLP